MVGVEDTDDIAIITLILALPPPLRPVSAMHSRPISDQTSGDGRPGGGRSIHGAAFCGLRRSKNPCPLDDPRSIRRPNSRIHLGPGPKTYPVSKKLAGQNAATYWRPRRLDKCQPKLRRATRSAGGPGRSTLWSGRVLCPQHVLRGAVDRHRPDSSDVFVWPSGGVRVARERDFAA